MSTSFKVYLPFSPNSKYTKIRIVSIGKKKKKNVYSRKNVKKKILNKTSDENM